MHVCIYKFSYIDILLLMISMLHAPFFSLKKNIEPRQSYHLPCFNAIPFIQYVFGGKGCGIGSDGILPPSFIQVPVTKYWKHKGCFKAWLEGLVWQRHASGNL